MHWSRQGSAGRSARSLEFRSSASQTTCLAPRSAAVDPGIGSLEPPRFQIQGAQINEQRPQVPHIHPITEKLTNHGASGGTAARLPAQPMQQADAGDWGNT